MTHKPQFSVSLMCMDLMRAGEQLDVLNRHADQYHIDIMDGHFAPNITLSPDFVKACAQNTSRPLEMHLMVEQPNHWLELLAQAGATTISPHAETLNRDAFRTMNSIAALGCKAGLTLNPMTPVSEAQYLLERIDLLTIMTVDVGYAGQPFISEMLTKIEEAATFKSRHGLDYTIQIDGSCNGRTYKQLHDAGAEMFILGSSGLFNLDRDLDNAWHKAQAEFTAATGITPAA